MAAVWCVCVYAFLVCLIVNHLRAYTHIRSVDATYFPAAVSRSGLQNLLAGYFLGFIYILTFQLAITCLHALCLFERADNKTAKTWWPSAPSSLCCPLVSGLFQWPLRGEETDERARSRREPLGCVFLLLTLFPCPFTLTLTHSPSFTLTSYPLYFPPLTLNSMFVRQRGSFLFSLYLFV